MSFANGYRFATMFERRSSDAAIEHRNTLIEELDARCVRLERQCRAAVARADRADADKAQLQAEASHWMSTAQELQQKLAAAYLELTRERILSTGERAALRDTRRRLEALAPNEPLADPDNLLRHIRAAAEARAEELGYEVLPGDEFDIRKK